ncbi:CD9 antigen isoform X1 [Gasterosteus aculeatus]
MNGPSGVKEAGRHCTRSTQPRENVSLISPDAVPADRDREPSNKSRLPKPPHLPELLVMALDGCGLFCKYVLIIFNLIFAVLGFALLGLGLWLRFSISTRGIFQIEELNSSAFVTVVTILIVLGSVMLIVVIFGDYGTCNEKRCALQVFTGLLSFLAVAVIACGVLSYSNRNAVGERFVEFYASMYTLYLTSNGDQVIAATLSLIHNTLHCCGMTGIASVEWVQSTCPPPDGFLEHFKMPGCPAIIATFYDSKAQLVMGVFVGTGALLLIAAICSSTLSRKIGLSNSSVQYIVLAHSTSVASNPQPSLHGLVSPSYLDQDPVVFTPLSMANIPMVQS